MGPRIPHYVGRDRVLAIDFEREQVLLAEMDGEQVRRHVRLRFAGDGSLVRDVPRRGQQIQLPNLSAESHVWETQRRSYTYRATIRPERAYAHANRRALLKVVEHAHKLSAKSLGRGALMLVEASAEGLHVESLGRVRVRKTFACAGARRDGLGSRVVLAAALLQLLKDWREPRVQVVCGHDNSLSIHGEDLWTVNAAGASRLPACEGPELSCEIIGALRRALVFVTIDGARPNLHQVLVTFDDTQIKIQATDGHRCFSEALAAEGASAFASRKYMQLPPAAVKQLTKPKKATHATVRAGAGPDAWEIEGDEGAFVVEGPVTTFPPANMLLAEEWGKGLSTCTLEPEHWQALRDECRVKYKSKGVCNQYVHICFGRESVQLSCHWREVDRKGDVTDVVQTEPVTIGKEEPRDKLHGLDLVYLWEVLDAFDEDSDVSIRFNPTPNKGAFFFRQGERVVLLMPVRL